MALLLLARSYEGYSIAKVKNSKKNPSSHFSVIFKKEMEKKAKEANISKFSLAFSNPYPCHKAGPGITYSMGP